MKLFKKFFTGVSNFFGKIGKSKGWEITKFVFKSITACVDFKSALDDFLEQMKLVWESLKVIAKWSVRGIVKWTSKANSKVVAFAK